jgi:hypothetical protein
MKRAAIRIFCFAALFTATWAAAVAPEELWSLQPVKSSALPRVEEAQLCRTPVDFFVLARLEKEGLTLNPEADRRTLIRRLTFDLHGVPPTREEIDRFITDVSPRAYEELAERLLASPRYGEHWARHWLDVVRYTESQGFEYDHLRPNAWHYRDYVVDGFNSDKPYDQFIREQIAGDVIDPTSPDDVIATSLLVCGPWDQAGNSQANATQKAITREEELEDLVSVVAQGFLGITVNCARCHSHKFDPVPQSDYYRIKAVFEGVRHGERSIASPRDRDAREAEIAALKRRFSDERELDRAMKALKPLPVSYAGIREQPAPTRLLKRGDVKQPGEEMRAGALSAVRSLPSDFGLGPNAPEAERRMRFAEWIADPRNPLTPRVMANRIWQYHFGQGIVATPSDLGSSGARPSHPELLDWLSASFVEHGWSIKSLHRLIVCSAAYRQSSSFKAEAAKVDAENQLLWRFKPRRLEAESVRDSILSISGSMNWKMGGPSFRPFDVVTFNSSTYIPRDFTGPDFDRRTIYRANVNSGKDPLLDALDCPEPSVKTPRRMVTMTPLQALSLMNNPFIQREAERLAQRILAEHASGELPVERVYESVLGRKPSTNERAAALNEALDRGLWHVCWALFNSTEFLYVR